MEKANSNFNGKTLTLVYRLIVLGAIGWVGTSIQSHTIKLSEISQNVAVLENKVDTQGKEQVSQGNAIAQIQYELARRPIAPSPRIKP